MKRNPADIQFSSFTAEREWTADGIPVLSALVELPFPEPAENRIARRIRRFYRLQSRAFLHYCEHCLFPLAEAEYRAALAASAPLPHFRAELCWKLTYRTGSLISLYTQSREDTAAGTPLFTRRGDTWDLAAGYPVALSECFPPHTPWKKHLLAQVAAEIEQQERIGIARYHDSWRRQLRRAFHPKDFYLTEEGLAVFFPMYAIAPAAERIPVFLIPYGNTALPDPANGKNDTAP